MQRIRKCLYSIWCWQHHLQRIHRSIGQICPPKLGTVDGCKIWIRHIWFFFGSTSFVMDQSTEAIHSMLGPHRIHRNWVFPIQWKQRWMVFCTKMLSASLLENNQAYQSFILRWIIQLNRFNRYCCTLLLVKWNCLMVIHVTCRGVPWTGIPSSCGGCRFTWCRIALLPWE